MSYPGNTSLSSEIQQRVLSTFEHTLELAEEGSREEALLGCDFILRLDPLFEPARKLQKRLRAGEDDLGGGGFRETVSAARRSIAEGGGEPGEATAGGPPETSEAKEAAGDGLQGRLIRLLDERRFEEILELAESRGGEIEGHPVLGRAVATARERHEAAPYVESFVDAAERALAEGEEEAARAELAKARALDSTHPRLAAVESRLEAADVDLEAELAGLAGPPSADAEEAPPEAAPPETGASAEEDWRTGLEDLDLGDLDLGEEAPELELTGGEEGAAGGSAESEDERIEELLREGQEAYERQDYQGAIDAWSRIFLIDIDHAEANRRIEEARRLKAESERQLEEIFHDGLAHLDAGREREARRHFERVLERAPDHLQAREHLQQIEAGGAGAAAAPPRPAAAKGEAEGAEAEAPPPVPLRRPPSVQEERPRRRTPSRTFLWIGGLVLLLALAGGWYLYSHRDAIFPNSTPPAPQAERPAAPNPLERAKALQRSGETQVAIAQLRRIPPSSPLYSEAQSLIAQWETSPAAEEEPAPEPQPEEQLARRRELIDAARSAARAGRDLQARELLERADAIVPLEADELALAERVEESLEPLQQQLELFRQGDWEYALPDLWLLHEDAPGDPDVQRLIVDAYYNLGIRDLQRGYPSSAARKFEEAMELAGDDPGLERLHRFASTYEERPQDLLYRIYVKYLPFR